MARWAPQVDFYPIASLPQTASLPENADTGETRYFSTDPFSSIASERSFPDRGPIGAANPQVCALLGVPHAYLTGRRLAQFVPPEQASSLMSLLQRTFASPARQMAELTLQPAAGAPLRVIVEVVADLPGEEPARCRLTLTDITPYPASPIRKPTDDLSSPALDDPAERRYLQTMEPGTPDAGR